MNQFPPILRDHEQENQESNLKEGNAFSAVNDKLWVRGTQLYDQVVLQRVKHGRRGLGVSLCDVLQRELINDYSWQRALQLGKLWKV